MRKRRPSSFFPPEDNPNNTTIYTLTLCGVTLLGLLVILCSTSLSTQYTNTIFDQQFGNCSIYSCSSEKSKLAIILLVNYGDGDAYIEKLKRLIQRMKSNTDPRNQQEKDLVDLFIFPFTPYSFLSRNREEEQNNHYIQRIRNIIFPSEQTDQSGLKLTDIFGNIKIENPIPDIYTPDDLLIHLYAHSKDYFPHHCFIQLLSLHTYFLKKNWLNAIISRSLDAFSQNFWMKGSIDMSFHPFSTYEEIEISLNSIYAIHCPCMANLIDYAAEQYPKLRIEKSINNLLRNPMQTRLAQWLAPRILPTSIGVNFESTKITIQRLKSNFPDAYFAFGKQILENE